MTQKKASLIFAIMGAADTARSSGKSTFFRLLTNDMTQLSPIRYYNLSTIQVGNYIHQATGFEIVLIDTPDFDDSRAGIAITDFLRQIVDKNRWKLNGIISVHSILDSRVGSVSKKSLETFYSLCGEKIPVNVRIVTTDWSRVAEEEGSYREANLRDGTFKPLIDAGAQMRRYADTVGSAWDIMSELIPPEAVTTAKQEEVQAGMTLKGPGVGRVLAAELQELRRKHERDMAELRKEAKENNQVLRAEFELERKTLEEKIMRAEVDRAELEKALEDRRDMERKIWDEEKVKLAQRENTLLAQLSAARERVTRLDNEVAKRQDEPRIANGRQETAGSTTTRGSATQLTPPLPKKPPVVVRQSKGHQPKRVVILVMGATGTGKSTFINLLTGDDEIRIGHSQQSETFKLDTAHYIDQATGRSITLVDTPGFDDSREGATDIDLLGKIVRFLEPESGERINVNGIIFMHRISDPRVGGTSRRNLKMFYSLCGEQNLANVRVITTNWSRVTEEEGKYREADLMNGAFIPLIEAGARMHRYANTVESAQLIMSELIPLPSVTMKIQAEVRAGKKLEDTSAGQVLTEEARELRKKHEQELAELERELKEAEMEGNQALVAEQEQERRILVEKMEHADADRQKLQITLAMMHTGSTPERREPEIFRKTLERSEGTTEQQNNVRLDRATRDGVAQSSRTRPSVTRTGSQRNLVLEQDTRLGVSGCDASTPSPKEDPSGARTGPQNKQTLERNNGQDARENETAKEPQGLDRRTAGTSIGKVTEPAWREGKAEKAECERQANQSASGCQDTAKLSATRENVTQSTSVLPEKLPVGVQRLNGQQHTPVVILIMGATGTGKSTFINLLTGDDEIRIGHTQQSETFGVSTARYIDLETHRSITLVDTPGFDDSREGVTDVDLLGDIVRFLEPESGDKINVNGIIYMHRISDPRVGGTSKKNLNMFSSLCGENNLTNVCIVTTNWSRVTEEEGNHREADLKSGAFKSLINAGAHMCRHANTLESAHEIMSQLIHLAPMVMEIQAEMRAGKKLEDTSAGQVLMAEAQELRKKHEQELAELEREVKEAEKERNQALVAEQEQERQALVAKMERADADRQKLQVTLAPVRAGSIMPERGEPETSMKTREKNEGAEEQNNVWLDGTGRDGMSQGSSARPSMIRTESQRNRALEQNTRLDTGGRDASAAHSKESPSGAGTEPQKKRASERNIGLNARGQRPKGKATGTSKEPQGNQELEQSDVEPGATGRAASAPQSKGTPSGVRTRSQTKQESERNNVGMPRKPDFQIQFK